MIVIQEKQESELQYSYETVSQNLEELCTDINRYLFGLIGVPIDISSFKVTYIEICFNVYTEYVEQYITLFNLIYEKRSPAKYVNYVLKRDLSRSGSFYVKGKIQYEKNVSNGYVINFYNKKDQLQYLQNKLIQSTPDRKRDIIEIDDAISNILSISDLRMEVQCHYKALYDLYGTADRSFATFIDTMQCRDIIKGRYEWLIGDSDISFFSYNAAKDKINQSSLSITKKRNLQILLLKVSRNNTLSVSQLVNYKLAMKSLGMHWYVIPGSMNIDYLESPIKKLDIIIEKTDLDKETYLTRQYANLLETAMSNSITATDDSSVIIQE